MHPWIHLPFASNTEQGTQAGAEGQDVQTAANHRVHIRSRIKLRARMCFQTPYLKKSNSSAETWCCTQGNRT